MILKQLGRDELFVLEEAQIYVRTGQKDYDNRSGIFPHEGQTLLCCRSVNKVEELTDRL